MKIIIITTEPFPNGMAATNRILSYAKGFKHLDIDSKILCIKPTEKKGSAQNYFIKGNFEGINYYYTCEKINKSANFFKRRFINIKGIFNAIREIRKEKKTDEKLIVINYTSQLLYGYLFYFIAKIYHYLYIKEESEHPYVYYKKHGFVQNIWLPFIIKNYYTLFDGLFLISESLISFFLDLGFKKERLLHVPMTVDFERFNIEKKENIQKTIVYSGSLNNKKDGVNVLLKAFNEVVKIYPNANLKLIGEPYTKELDKEYRQFVNSQNLINNVEFLGKILRQKIPDLIVNADVLVLPRPHSTQAQYGFPTKLGEYLASGNPVVCTKVGEIPRYLTDGKDAYLCEPDNISSLAEKIIFALKYPEIGKEGKKTAISHFNLYVQTKKILEFITIN